MAGGEGRLEARTCWENGETGDHGAGTPPWAVPGAGTQGERLARLVRTIEGEVIPRLMLAHQAPVERSVFTPATTHLPDADDVAEFARLVINHDAAVGVAYVEAMLAQGVALETLYLDLMAPAARHLGALWEEDLCPFTDVTVGLSRLHQILHEVGPAWRNETEPVAPAHRILLVPAPGEQHHFGIVMVEEFFRCAGWEVWGGPPASVEELAERVRDEWFDVIGLSMSAEGRLDTLAASIRAVRRASRNRDLHVMVGGRAFERHPELVARVGADATANDGRQAVVKAQNLLALLVKRN